MQVGQKINVIYAKFYKCVNVLGCQQERNVCPACIALKSASGLTAHVVTLLHVGWTDATCALCTTCIFYRPYAAIQNLELGNSECICTVWNIGLFWSES